MEKSKEQILMEKLRKVSHRLRLGQLMRPGMPPMPGGPHGPGMGGGFHGGPHGPGMGGGCHGEAQGPARKCHAMGQPGPGMPAGCHRGPGGMMPPMGPHGPGGMYGRIGLPPREMLLLAVLEQDDAGIRQKDLAAALGINASSLSEQIDRLETERYLERRENPDDKRSTLIFLTEKGKARAWEAQDDRQRSAEQFCAHLTDEEKDTLIRLLDKLLTA